jgi:methionyl-tRNA synthetase
MSPRYLVTSGLPYSNGRLHVGHIAGAYLPADTYVRYLRSRARTSASSAAATTTA